MIIGLAGDEFLSFKTPCSKRGKYLDFAALVGIGRREFYFIVFPFTNTIHPRNLRVVRQALMENALSVDSLLVDKRSKRCLFWGERRHAGNGR